MLGRRVHSKKLGCVTFGNRGGIWHFRFCPVIAWSLRIGSRTQRTGWGMAWLLDWQPVGELRRSSDGQLRHKVLAVGLWHRLLLYSGQHRGWPEAQGTQEIFRALG